MRTNVNIALFPLKHHKWLCDDAAFVCYNFFLVKLNETEPKRLDCVRLQQPAKTRESFFWIRVKMDKTIY